MVFRFGLQTAAALGFAGSALEGATPSISLKMGEEGSVISQTYSCEDGRILSVQYVNAGVNSLALLPINGNERVFVAVISGSGVRYVSGQFTWWTKGKTAMLNNVMDEESNTNCVEKTSSPSE